MLAGNWLECWPGHWLERTRVGTLALAGPLTDSWLERWQELWLNAGQNVGWGVENWLNTGWSTGSKYLDFTMLGVALSFSRYRDLDLGGGGRSRAIRRCLVLLRYGRLFDLGRFGRCLVLGRNGRGLSRWDFALSQCSRSSGGGSWNLGFGR